VFHLLACINKMFSLHSLIQEDSGKLNEMAEDEGFRNFLKQLKDNIKVNIRRRPNQVNAEIEGLYDLCTLGKNVYKAYKKYQGGTAEKESESGLYLDTGRVLDVDNQVTGAEDGEGSDDLAEDEAFFTIPTLLYGAYNAYKLYNEYKRG